MPEPRIAGGTSEAGEASVQVPEDGMAMTDHVSALHLLEATHTTDASFAMLMISLTVLLLQLPGAVLCFGDACL